MLNFVFAIRITSAVPVLSGLFLTEIFSFFLQIFQFQMSEIHFLWLSVPGRVLSCCWFIFAVVLPVRHLCRILYFPAQRADAVWGVWIRCVQRAGEGSPGRHQRGSGIRAGSPGHRAPGWRQIFLPGRFCICSFLLRGGDVVQPGIGTGVRD